VINKLQIKKAHTLATLKGRPDIFFGYLEKLDCGKNSSGSDMINADVSEVGISRKERFISGFFKWLCFKDNDLTIEKETFLPHDVLGTSVAKGMGASVVVGFCAEALLSVSFSFNNAALLGLAVLPFISVLYAHLQTREFDKKVKNANNAIDKIFSDPDDHPLRKKITPKSWTKNVKLFHSI